MKKKIKKWYIIILIILGIGAYWLSQNMWIFEKKILVDDYDEFLKDTEWVENEKKIWKFTEGYLHIYTPNNSEPISYIGQWTIVNDEDIEFEGIQTYNNSDVYWISNIIFVSNDNLLLEIVVPAVWNRGLIKLKRV